VELILPVMYDALVERDLPLSLLVRLLCEAPARRFGVWPQKGGLVPGADADLVIFDPQRSWVVDPAALVTPARWSPYAGRRLRGRVERTIARGQEVFDGEAVLGDPGRGEHVRPGQVAERAHA
jgi:dihydroorotase-like cyclic amidohydrolase